MKRRKTLWTLIAKSLGEKAGKNNTEADRIALIRLFITVQILLTNFFIIYGVLRTHHFPMKPSTQSLIDSLSRDLDATVEYKTLTTKTHTKQQITLTYNESRRHHGGDDTQQSTQ